MLYVRSKAIVLVAVVIKLNATSCAQQLCLLFFSTPAAAACLPAVAVYIKGAMVCTCACIWIGIRLLTAAMQ